MSTPNIEELVAQLSYYSGDGDQVDMARQAQRLAANALQSQAERIAELERESETHSKAYGLAIVERDNLRTEVEAVRKANLDCVDHYNAALDEINELGQQLKVAQEGWRCECSTDDACRFARERDALRAQLDAIAAADPVAWMVQFSPGSRWVELTKEEFDSDLDGHIVYKKQAFFTRPMPAQDVTLSLTDAEIAEVQASDPAYMTCSCMKFAWDILAAANAKGAK